MIQLREYQQQAIAGLRAAFKQGRRSPLLVSPTGSGKTVMFAYLCSQLAARGLRCYVLVHRDELIDQVARTLGAFDVQHSFVSPGRDHDRRALVQVCGVFSVARRLDRLPAPDYVIVDEAHHAIGRSTWGKVLSAWPDARRIGVTATPERLSGEGLGELFDEMVLGPSTRELIEAGHLSGYRIFAPQHAVDLSGVGKRGGDFDRAAVAAIMDKPAVVGDAVTQYAKHLNGAPAVVFTHSLAAAEGYVEAFRARGFRAAQVDGTMDRGLRRDLVAGFGAGQLNVLVSVDVISEGFDVPGIVGAILLRPTMSLGLYLQQVGRALRTAPGKKQAIILDHVGNSLRHGMPDDDREWSLIGREKGRRSKAAQDAARQCPSCYAVMPAAARQCSECGHVFEVQAREVEQVDGELAEIEIERARREAKRAQAAAESLDALIELGRMRGYGKPEAWARHVWAARQNRRTA